MRTAVFGKFMVVLAAAGLGFTLGTSFTVEASASAAAKVPAAAPAAAPAAKPPAAAPAAPAECKKDADCALVPDDCCSCNEGGAQRAISGKQKDTYEKQRTKRCGGTMCAQMMSTHPSCSQRAVCAAGLCKLG